MPVIYDCVEDEGWIRVDFSDGTSVEQPGHTLAAEWGRELHLRTGWIVGIRVGIPVGALRDLESEPEPGAAPVA